MQYVHSQGMDEYADSKKIDLKNFADTRSLTAEFLWY